MRNTHEYSEFTDRFDHHREKSSAREHLLRGEGFKDLNEKYGHNYDYFDSVNHENSDKYVQYRERYYESYWDTKENSAYYSQSATTRAWLAFKKVNLFWRDCVLLWGGLALCFVVYSARTHAAKINVSHAYL